MQRSALVMRDCPGGRRGIRTHEGLAPLPVFKTGAFNRSASLPTLGSVGAALASTSSLRRRHVHPLQAATICGMHALRRRLRGCTWLALLATVALALGPTISRLALPEEPPPRAALALAAPMDHAAMHHAAMDPAGMHAHHHHAASIDAP